MNKTTEHLLEYVLLNKKSMLMIQNPETEFNIAALKDRAIIYHCDGETDRCIVHPGYQAKDIEDAAAWARKENKALFIGDIDLAHPEALVLLMTVLQQNNISIIVTVTKNSEEIAYIGTRPLNLALMNRFIVHHTLQEV